MYMDYQLFFLYTPFSTTYDVWDAVWVFWVGESWESSSNLFSGWWFQPL